MSGHTPGPWKVGESNCAVPGYTDIDSESWGALASVATANRDALAEGRANARLIAAAPELLEALQELLSPAKDAVGAVGEFNSMPCQSLQAKLPITVLRLEARFEKARAAIAKAISKELAA